LIGLIGSKGRIEYHTTTQLRPGISPIFAPEFHRVVDTRMDAKEGVGICEIEYRNRKGKRLMTR
ncbi:hypothetical protein EJB05_38843, partial [Eragrostis curvula]